MRKTIGLLILGALLIAATPTAFGGWAVVTMQQMPEHLEAGVPTTLSFKIRQHGRDLLSDRSPTVTLRDTRGNPFSRFRSRIRVDAVRGTEAGLYTATVTPRRAGEVSVSIDTDLYGWKVKLLPLRVVAPRSQPRPLALRDRGLQLYVAKGCVTCHAIQNEPALAGWQLVPVGPELTNRQFPEELLAEKIADPARFRSDAATNSARMPTLALDDEEIRALVSFLNAATMTAGSGS